MRDDEAPQVARVKPAPRGVCGKARYPGERSAWRAIRQMQRYGKGRNSSGRLHPYVCTACRAWHVGHSAFE